MAFASVGSFGTFQSATADQSSMAFVTSATLEAGNFAVLAIAVDNFQTTDGDEGAVTSITDTSSNTWTKAKEMCNGQGSATAGTTVSLWYSLIGTQLNSGATITINLSNNTARDRTCATGWEYTVAGGATVAIEGTSGTVADDGAADPSSLDVTTSNIACLRIRACSVEASESAFTPTSSWTGFTAINTASGGATANQGCITEFIISTGTGAASTPNKTDASTRDWASVYVAFKESTPAVIVAGGGSYAIAGTAATLKVARKVAAAAGSYAIAGTAATLKVARKVAAAAGSYSLAGSTATLRRNLPLVAGAGSYAVAGTAASVLHGWKLPAAAGSYAVSGTAATLLHGWKIAAAAGSYTVNGSDASLIQTGVKILAAGGGGYTITGNAASLLHSWNLPAASGSYAINGTAAALLQGHVVPVAGGSYTITGSAAALVKLSKLSAGGGSYLLSGADVSFVHSIPAPVPEIRGPLAEEWGFIGLSVLIDPD